MKAKCLNLVSQRAKDRKAALQFLNKSMKPYGDPNAIATDKLRPYGAATAAIGNAPKQKQAAGCATVLLLSPSGVIPALQGRQLRWRSLGCCHAVSLAWGLALILL